MNTASKTKESIEVQSPASKKRRVLKSLRHSAEYFFYRFLSVLISLLPQRLLPLIASAVSAIAPWLLFWQTRIAMTNLDLVYGSSISLKEKQTILRQSYRTFALTVLYFLWSRNLDEQRIRHLVEIDPSCQDLIENTRRNGRGCIVMPGHYGNWEVMCVACGYLLPIQTNIIVHPTKNPWLDKWINNYRMKSGNRIVYSRGSMFRVRKLLRKGESVVLMQDLCIDPSYGGIFVPFLGLPAATSPATAVLSLRMGTPIIRATCNSLPKGRYRLHFDGPLSFDPSGEYETDVRRLTTICNESLEEMIRKRPGEWNWFYKRWRVRPTLEQGEYPDYSKPERALRKRRIK